MSRRPSVRGVVAGVLVAGSVVTVSATSAAPRVAIVNVDVAKDTQYRSGEPEIAVNPRNPANMVYVASNFRHVPLAGGVEYPNTLVQFGTPVTGTYNLGCTLSYTEDGGNHWYHVPWPLRDRPACGDPMVVVDKDGTFSIAFDAMGSPTFQSAETNPLTDQVAYSRSTDGGRSWSPSVDIGTIVDRPWLRIDTATGWLYEQSGGLLPGQNRTLTVSKDQGRTWSTPVAWNGNHIAVHAGELATVTSQYNSFGVLGSAVTSTQSAQLTFQLSSDGGRTSSSVDIPGATGAYDWISADPSRKGGFAVMQQFGNVFEVFVTPDGGKTWSTSAPITNDASRAVTKEWMDYGPNGVLAVMWKSTTADGNHSEVYATISRDHGRHFAKPLKVSTKPSPFEDFNTDGAGDDMSWVTVDGHDAYLGWGDLRTGELDGWFAKVPLDAF